MNEFEVNGKTFRIKKMNAIEILALRQHVDFENFSGTMKLFNLALEHIEHKVKESWIQVKQGNDYYPSGLEEDITLVNELISTFLNWLKSVFPKSSESN